MPSFSHIKTALKLLGKLDRFALFFHVVLLLTGVTFIYGAGVEVGGELATKWYMQLLWIGAGSTLYLFCALVDYRKLAHFSLELYIIGLLLLLFVCIFGKEINGAKSWITLAGGVTLQPSELAKPATLLFLCWAVTHKAWHKSPVPPWLIVSVIIAPPLLLVMLQPDFGTALVFFPFSFAIAFVKGLKWKWIAIGAVGVLFLVPVAFQRLKPHQKARVAVFLEQPAHAVLVAIAPFIPEDKVEKLRERQDEFFYPTIIKNGRKIKTKPHDNWNAQQSLLAVGSGGMTGKGFLKGTQHVLGYLPQRVAPTDFIFSVIAEETGFFGSAMLLVSFICIILCGCRTALLAADELGLCIALGVAVIFATHTFINIGMTVQAAPIIGIPLPFVSYGGSFMLGTMILAGLSQSVHIRHDMKYEDD